ncbi:MAG: Anthranilate 1,2-dioxygenase small subunit [Alphaproteobacteria bacterium MarineAlpha4_Bin2]|nr:MAG: Anthranilate 1,2-dioxygenase small subunit [Alphaproteobacteria bacterium MarineAlpha4_Bin2]
MGADEMIAPECRNLIENFLLDCAHDLDDDRLEAWPDYFTTDAIYRILPRESHEKDLPLGVLYCEGRGMMIDRIDALRTANIYEPHSHCHVLGPTRLQKGFDGTYAARTNFTVIRTKQDGTMDVYAAGKYLDKLVFKSETPLIQDRQVVLESRRIDILLVVPL